jgi:LysR family hca operon transcriptional activator
MDMKQLKYFIAVAEALNFRRAAEHLCMTQPPLSQKIRQLEDELGTPLLLRNTRQVSLTPAGEYFLHKAQHIIQQMHQVSQEVRDIGLQTVRPIRIGYSGTSTFVAPVMQSLKDYASLNSNIRLNMTCTNAKDLQKQLLAGQLDLALIRSSQPPVSPKIDYRHLSEEPFFLLIPPENSLAQASQIRPEQLSTQTLITYRRSDNTALRQQIDRYLIENACQPADILEVSDIAAMVNMMQFGMGVTMLPESVARAFSEQYIARPVLGLENTIGLYLCVTEQGTIARHLFDTLLRLDLYPLNSNDHN